MKLARLTLVTAILAIALSPTAYADESLGDVIRDSVRDELRDGVRDAVREDVICDGKDTDVCGGLNDLDEVRDDIRGARNTIRAIDAIF